MGFYSNNKLFFKEFENTGKRQKVLIGNNNTAKVYGRGTVELLFTSRKKITLVNVLYVPEIRQNLVSVSLLSKKGFKTVFETEKLIISKNDVFVRKRYSCEIMLKFRIDNNNNSLIFAYMLNFFSYGIIVSLI